MPISPPFNLMKWIDDNRDLLRPPVSNQAIWQDGDFIVQIIGGPNTRIDYHVDPYEEIFFQLTGDMVLPVMEDGAPRDIPIREGEIFLLPAFVPHSPQRPDPNGIGLVVERTRPDGVKDAFEWYCEKCGDRVHRAEVQLTDIVGDLPPVFTAYNQNADLRKCPSCGHDHPAR
jgi:3-hydroxyanthranilate 3,4-dioxygenase